MKKNPLILLLFCIGRQTSPAQSYDAQRTQVFVTNVVSNALLGGIGGAINHAGTEKWYVAFTRNFFKGALGGVVKYTARYQTYYFYNPYNSIYAPVNRLYYFLGHSMVMNAAYNRKLLERLYCNFYGIDIRYNSRAEQKVQARVSLATLEGVTEYALKGYELNLYRTLQYGIFMFDARGTKLLPYYGQARFNCVVLQNSPSLGEFPHELVHNYQLYDLFPLSAVYDKKARGMYENKKWYKQASRFVVIDHESLYFTTLYLSLFHFPPAYYKNYFEFEAEHFNSRAFVVR